MTTNILEKFGQLFDSPGGKALLQQAEAAATAEKVAQRAAALAELERLSANEAAAMMPLRAAEARARLDLEAARRALTEAEERLAQASTAATVESMRLSGLKECQIGKLRGLKPDAIVDYEAELVELAAAIWKAENDDVAPKTMADDLYGQKRRERQQRDERREARLVQLREISDQKVACRRDLPLLTDDAVESLASMRSTLDRLAEEVSW